MVSCGFKSPSASFDLDKGAVVYNYSMRYTLILLVSILLATGGGCMSTNRGGGTTIQKVSQKFGPDGKEVERETINVKNEQPDNPKDSAKTTINEKNEITTSTGAADQSAKNAAAANKLLQPVVWFGGIMTFAGIIGFIAAPKVHPLVPKIAMGMVIGGVSLVIMGFLLAKYALYVGLFVAVVLACIGIYLLRKYALTDKALAETVEFVEDEVKPALPDDAKATMFEARDAVAKDYQSKSTQKIVNQKRKDLKK